MHIDRIMTSSTMEVVMLTSTILIVNPTLLTIATHYFIEASLINNWLFQHTTNSVIRIFLNFLNILHPRFLCT
jgi:hypothetical protein